MFISVIKAVTKKTKKSFGFFIIPLSTHIIHKKHDFHVRKTKFVILKYREKKGKRKEGTGAGTYCIYRK